MEQEKLGDEQVQRAISHFITESRKSAETLRDDETGGVLGFAAMSTILACVSAVGEAIFGKRATGHAIGAFYDSMTERMQWILPPKGTSHTESQVRQLLIEIRNDLAHSLTLPLEVVLLPNRAANRLHETRYGEEHLRKWKLIVPEFIDAVEKTVRKVSHEHPTLEWDPGRQPHERRGLVDTYTVSDHDSEISNKALATLLSTSGSSAGSAASATFGYPQPADWGTDDAMSITLPSDAE